MGENSNAIAIDGLGHLVIRVRDLEKAGAFYTDALGFTRSTDAPWSEDGHAAVLDAAGAARLLLVQSDDLPDLTATGVHQAYSVNAQQREMIASRLADLGCETHTYKEDYPPEESDPFYTFDPDGNRIQLVVSEKGSSNDRPALDHAAIQVANLISAEWFYCDVLGLPVAHRVGWRTADYIRAQAWERGEEDMAPGTRRLDKRYTVMVNKKVVARVNMQLFVRVGNSALGVYLANQHFQEPPEDILKGSPRIGYRASMQTIDEACRRLDAADCLHSGPIVHTDGGRQATSLYFRDPGGNFLELVAAS